MQVRRFRFSGSGNPYQAFNRENLSPPKGGGISEVTNSVVRLMGRSSKAHRRLS